MMIRGVVLGAAAFGLLLGCDDDDKPTLLYRDSAAPAPDGQIKFLEPCQQDSDCASGHCRAFGATTRCSRPCDSDSPCPAFEPWSCAERVCECSGTARQPDRCDFDGDCDGALDKPPTTERCNREDDDCNGIEDDVGPGAAGATQLFRDADKDKFGDARTSRWSCTPIAGWVENNEDCDDTRIEVNPDAEEVCGDLLDNDCDFEKEDRDICGLAPVAVPDVSGNDSSGLLKSCGTTAGLPGSLDIKHIVAKQDDTAIKFTVQLVGAPALATCTTYALHLGDPKQSASTLVYLYRPGLTACGSTPTVEALRDGQPFTSTMQPGFNPADPGHVSFVIEKSEALDHLPTPTYRLRACANATADRTTDPTQCVDDSCETPVHK